MVGAFPKTIFIDINNTVTVLNTPNKRILSWFAGNNVPNVRNTTDSTEPISLFISTNNIYINNDNNGVNRWVVTTTGNAYHLHTGGTCFDLFIDNNNTLYCSLKYGHKVIKRSLDSNDDKLIIIAGTGCPGFLSNTLNEPHGIFVDDNLDLYIADSMNNRIQLFRSGQLNGMTVVGKEAPGTIILKNPSDVILDGDDNIFIVDTSNDRIVGSTSTGFRCIVGCIGYGITGMR